MKIESKIPIPPPGRARTKYPWGGMKVGQSFFLSEKDYPPSGSATLRSAAWSWAKNHGWKFTTKKEKGGYRVWRTA